ncbi:MAG: tetratricopeptide repeat protein [Planctomycetota bacterium]
MRPLQRLAAAVLALAGACAVPEEGPAAPPPGSATAKEDPALEAARRLIADARAAKYRGDPAAARAKAREAIEGVLVEDGRGDSAARIAMLSELGDFAHDADEWKAAEKARRRVLEDRSRALPEDHPELQRARGRLAGTLYSLGDLPGARALFEKVLEVSTRTLPDDHHHLQLARMNLALTIRALGDLQGARALEERVLEVFSATLPEDHPHLQLARVNLALTIEGLGDYEGARELLERVLEVYSRTLPDDHSDLQSARNNLALTIHKLGDLKGARALEEQVLEVQTRTLSADHHDVQSARQNLAVTIKALGDLQGARVLEERVLEAYSRTLPDDHPDVQSARGNLAVTLYSFGDLQGARALQEQVLGVLSRTVPDDDVSLQTARQNLAVTLFALGDIESARALIEKVLEVRARTLPEEHPDLQWAKANLAGTLKRLGDLQGARALDEEVLEVLSRTLPDDHRDLQEARGNLAWTMYWLDDLEGARALQEKVLEVRTRTLPEDHPELQRARVHLAATIAAETASATGAEEYGEDGEGGREQCASLVQAFARSCARIANVATLTSSSREAEERCSSLQRRLSVSLSFATGYGVFDLDPTLARDAFVFSEATRGSALASARLASLARSDERYAELREAIKAAGEQLARLAQSGAARDAYDATVAERDRAQRELVQLATKAMDSPGLLVGLDPAALVERLSEHDAIVTYRRYTRWEIPAGETKERKTESLCAFVLRKEAELELLDLGPIAPIETAVSDWRDALGIAEGRGLGVASRPSSTPDATQTAERVRTVILDPLRPNLRGVRRLVMVLDDVLQAVPIDALPAMATEDRSASKAEDATPGTTGQDLLGDRYEIELRSTTQELLGSSAPRSGEQLVLLVGGADYFASPSVYTNDPRGSLATSTTDTEEPKAAVVASLLRSGAWGEGFAPLPMTLAEARGLEDLAQRAGEGRDVLRLQEEYASRESIEELAPKARFLHLATHGWFAPESIRSWNDPDPVDGQGAVGARMSAEERVKGSSPMLLCGLALAGANLPADAVGRYPGIVTAEEISSWDLANCELAVLSACDTNVGERRAGQGVASLQKALHMAGARTVITSLWKVPDEATKELMLDFYRRIWVEKEPKARALWEAKKCLREAKDERGRPKYSTRDWAAWVLTGEPD